MKTVHAHRLISISIALMLALALLPACSGKPKPAPAATSPVGIPEGSFADGRGLQLGFNLLYTLDGFGGNSLIGTAGIAEVLAAAKDGAQGDTDTALAGALGMQEMLPKDIDDIALHLRQAAEKLQYGKFTTAWGLFVGDQQAVKESYLSDCGQSLKLNAIFQQIEGQAGVSYLNEWVDEATGGLVKKVNFKVASAKAPFFVDVFSADPDWQQALDTGKSRPLPFQYESGDEKAVPTMICYESCGVYNGAEGAMAILPSAGDETRLVVIVPPEKTGLHDFIPVAAAKFDEWTQKAEWSTQRVLLPRFAISFEGSLMNVLNRAGIGSLLAKGKDYGAMGDGLYIADILHKASLTVDESGVDSPDPNAVYHQGVKDNIPTLAVCRPFIVMLVKSDTGQVLAMGFVRDPLTATLK